MADIHSLELAFTHSLAIAEFSRSLPAWHPVPVSDEVAQCAQRSFAQGGLTSRLCSYDLMCQSQSLPPASLLHSLVSLCSLDHPLLVSGTFPTLRLPNPSLDAWTYTPAASGVLLPVSSSRASAFPNAVAGRRFSHIPCNDFCTGTNFGAAVISLCSGLQLCLPPRSFLPT